MPIGGALALMPWQTLLKFWYLPLKNDYPFF
jgi:hypothetical protein